MITSLFLLQACDVTSSDDDDDEHNEPFGIVLLEGGNEIARQFSGEVTYPGGEHIELGVGEESPLITVRFLNDHGEMFEPEDGDEFLAWEIEQESILEIEHHDEDGKWSFHFVGAGAGITHVTFLLMHGDENSAHADFESLEFEIHVEGT